jgi:uncharacterized protein
VSGTAHASGAPTVYAVPVLDRWLVFSPLSWAAAVVNHAAAAALARHAEGKGAPDAPEDGVAELWQELTSRVVSPQTGDGSPKLVIMPTRACNMRCVYCDFGAQDALGTTLDPRTACLLAEHFAAGVRAQGENVLRVHLFGGEPLVAGHCTKAIVHCVRALCARTGMVPWFEVTTNGLFDEGLVPFLGDYIDSIVVSLDGAESLHDHNRRRPDGRGTYADIAANLHRLEVYPAELCLRMCVTDRSVDSMAKVTTRLCGEFRFDVLSFEMLAENECSCAAGLAAPDPLRFAAGVMAAEGAAAAAGVRVVHGPSELVGPRTTGCPLGRGTLMLSPDGALTACYLDPRRWEDRGLDLSLGHVDMNSGVFIDEERLEAVAVLTATKPRCDRCFCRYTCAGGCHVDHTPPGCSLEYDDRCRAIRVTTAGRLLRYLGFGAEADLLIADAEMMRLLADHPDDRLPSWRAEL